MKYVDEYRDGIKVQQYAAAIAQLVTRPWTVMEICGGQTHSILKFGLDTLLPPEVRLIHGPGCPVCVTDISLIDQALSLAAQPNVIFCTFGDMMRVPGRETDLLTVKAQGGDVRMVYSPMDALQLCHAHPDKEVVFFGVGFETTAPATAMAIYQATERKITNFSVLVAHVLVPPAMEAILAAPDCQVQGFLAAGHVCAVTGFETYRAIAQRHRVPIVVTGFEPVDIMRGIYQCLQQLESGVVDVENQYARVVQNLGNQFAQQLMSQVFQVTDRSWRGLGMIPKSGLELREQYQDFDARLRLVQALPSWQSRLSKSPALAPETCMSGAILQGLKTPRECPAFGGRCKPEHPLGAPMVSSEGACAAYYRYRQLQVP